MAKNLTVNISLNGEIDFEKINETIRKEIERVGVKVEIPRYRKVTDREPRVGDFVKFEGNVETYLKAKEYYEIVEIDGCDDPQVIDDDGDLYDTSGNLYEVFERVTGAEEQPFKVGDYAKVIELCSGEVDTEIGDIVEVVSLHSGGGFIRYKVLRNGYRSGMYAKRFVKATDEEVAFAKFAKGDKVRLINGGGVHPLNGFKNGEIYTVETPKHYHSKTHGHRVGMKTSDGVLGYATPTQLEKLSEAEAQESVKWAKIGRKPAEFKKGDIVRVINSSGSSQRDGNIGEIADIHSAYYRVNSLDITRGNFLHKDQIELITPVEQRFDLAEDK
jgi:hypothetical protein